MKTVPCETCGDDTLMEATKRCDHCWETERRLRPYFRAKKGRDFARSILKQYELHDFALDYTGDQRDFVLDENGRMRIPANPPWIHFEEGKLGAAKCRYCNGIVEMPTGLDVDETTAVLSVRAGRHASCLKAAIENKQTCEHNVPCERYCLECGNEYVKLLVTKPREA